MDQIIDEINLKASFVGASYYKVHPVLISYTVELRNRKLYAQIIVFHDATEEELDDTMDILGGIVGDFNSLTADFKIIKVESLQEAEAISPLQIKLFHRAIPS